MKTISIIIITIVISIALCKQINNENQYLKSSSLLKAATNLDDCRVQDDKDKFIKFVQPAPGAEYVLYNISGTKYSYINQLNIVIVEIQSVGAIDKFKSIDYYSYPTPTYTGDKIANIIGTMKKHLELDTTGAKLNNKTIFYEIGKEPSDKYEVQLVNIGAAGTAEGTTTQSTCTFVDYTAESPAKPIITTITPFLLLDYAEGMVVTSDRETTLLYATILNKRMTKVDGTKYTTFYTKDNKICSISYDGVGIYTLYYSESPATPVILPVLDAKFLATIPEPTSTTFKSFTLNCKGDSGSKECTKSTPEDTSGNMGYTMVQSKTAPKPLYVFKSVTYWGKSTATDKLSMEQVAIEEIAKVWDGCVIDIEKVNNIGIYKYNIIILFIISLLYIL